MILCKVCGQVTASALEPGLEGFGFALLEREGGCRFVAADRFHAEPGSQVLVCEGASAQTVLGAKGPVDAAVVGIIHSDPT